MCSRAEAREPPRDESRVRVNAMRDIREFGGGAAVIGGALAALGAAFRPQHATSSPLFWAGVALLCLAGVAYFVPLLASLRSRSGAGRAHLRLEYGNSGEFDKVDVVAADDLPEYMLGAYRATMQRLGKTPSDSWLRMRKVVKVTNATRRQITNCRAEIVDVEPHDHQDVLPAPLKWNHTDAPVCDIAPRGHAYAVIYEKFLGFGDGGVIQNQRPLVSLSLEESVEVELTAWSDNGPSGHARVRLTGLHAPREYPVASPPSRRVSLVRRSPLSRIRPPAA